MRRCVKEVKQDNKVEEGKYGQQEGCRGLVFWKSLDESSYVSRLLRWADYWREGRDLVRGKAGS